MHSLLIAHDASGSEASQAAKDAEHHTDNQARGPPLEPQASEATVTPAMSGSGPAAADSSGELGSDEDGALPDDASPSASPSGGTAPDPDDAPLHQGAASKVSIPAIHLVSGIRSCQIVWAISVPA